MGHQVRRVIRHDYESALALIQTTQGLTNTALAQQLNTMGYATKSGRGGWDEASVRKIRSK